MVLQVTPETWAGATRKDAKGRDMAEWIRNHWDKP